MTKYKFQQKVRITSGIYKGRIGTVIGHAGLIFEEYQVAFDWTNYDGTQWTCKTWVRSWNLVSAEPPKAVE